MSVVKINAITCRRTSRSGFEERFRGRAGTVEKTPGFEWFELLRPLEGTDQYLVYTRWESEEAYRAWESSQDFDRAHEGRRRRAGARRPRTQHHLLVLPGDRETRLRDRPYADPQRRDGPAVGG